MIGSVDSDGSGDIDREDMKGTGGDNVQRPGQELEQEHSTSTWWQWIERQGFMGTDMTDDILWHAA